MDSKGNQQGFEESCLDNGKKVIDDVFPIVFEKPLDNHTSQNVKTKDDNTWNYVLCLARGIQQ